MICCLTNYLSFSLNLPYVFVKRKIGTSPPDKKGVKGIILG